MNRFISVVNSATMEFGNFVKRNPRATEFPELLVAKHKAKFASYWGSEFDDHYKAWCRPGIKANCFGTIVGYDLLYYVRVLGGLFDEILIRDPISYTLMKSNSKSPQGLYGELITYVNIISLISEWIEHGIVKLFPPIGLMSKELSNEIIYTSQLLVANDTFSDCCWNCRDRKLQKSIAVPQYADFFIDVFDKKHIEQQGDLYEFTIQYVIQALAEDIAIAKSLANRTGSIPVTFFDRHEELFKICLGGNTLPQQALSINENDVTNIGLNDRNSETISKAREALRLALTDTAKPPLDGASYQQNTIIIKKYIDRMGLEQKQIKLPYSWSYSGKKAGFNC